MKSITFKQGFVFFGLLSFTACGGDDLKNVSSISSKEITLSTDRTEGVEIIYSDSSRVKGRGVAPVLDKVTPSNGGVYTEMPKGVTIYFYDPNGKESGNLICDYAIRKELDLKTIFRKNVVVKNNQGDTFRSEELIWDEGKKVFYSTYRVYVTSIDGNSVDGVDFEAPQDFSSYKLSKGSGEVNIKENLTEVSN